MKLATISFILMSILIFPVAATEKDARTIDRQSLLKLMEGLTLQYDFERSSWLGKKDGLKEIEDISFKSITPIGGSGYWYSRFVLMTYFYDSESNALAALKSLEKNKTPITKCHAFVIVEGNRLYKLVTGCEQPNIFYQLLKNFKKYVLTKHARVKSAIRCKPGGRCRYGSGKYQITL